jgi:K+-sensing histidine kinase KdpD
MFAVTEVIDRRAAWAIALLGPAVAAVVMVSVRSHTQPSNLALVMVVVVAVSVVPGHRLAAVGAGLSAGVWFDFFLTRPYEQLSIQRSSDAQTTVLLAAVAIVIGEIAARRRKARRDGVVARGEVLGLYVVAQMLSAGASVAAVLDVVCDQLTELLGLSVCRFDHEPPAETDPVLDRGGALVLTDGDWGVEERGLPAFDVSLPVESGGVGVGRFVLRGSGSTALSQDRLLVAVALSDLVGAAMRSPTAELRP